MAIIAKASNGNGEAFTPAPPGLHRAICCDVVDLGMVQSQYGTKHKVRVIWQTETAMPDGKPFLVDQRYTLSLDERSNLRRDLEAWRGKPFTLAEAAGFDLERLIGASCGLLVVHKPGREAGKVFANIQSVLPALPGAPLKVRDYVRHVLRAGNGAVPTPIGPSFAPPPTVTTPPTPIVYVDPFAGAPAPTVTADDIPF